MVITVSQTAGIKCQVGDSSLLIDPPSNKKGSLILKTHTEMPVDSFKSMETVHGPGEYEIADIRVKGIELKEESDTKTIRSAYVVEFENIHLAFITDISNNLKEDALDKLGEIDVLFLSADTKKLKPKDLASLIKQVSPSIIIPITDSTAKVLSEEMGQKVKAEEKLVIKKKDIIKEGISNKLVWLKTK